MDDKWGSFAQVLFTKHETRMYRKEKEAFLECCEKEFIEFGYDDVIVKAERNMFGLTSKNLVAGPLDGDILITAHYDTPGRNGFLLFMNPLVGLLLSNILFLAIILLLDHYLLIMIENEHHWVSSLRIIVALVLIGSFIIKNKHNHNDNTSGVLGVYKMAELVAQNPHLKSRCTFILFDHEEVFPALLGSRAFANWRKKNYPEKKDSLVINLDCIGVGDVLTVMTRKKHEDWYSIASYMEREGFEVRRTRGGLIMDGDHAPFQKGVSLMFQEKSLLGPLYIRNIHTRKDRFCDLKQVERLCVAAYGYISDKTLSNWR